MKKGKYLKAAEKVDSDVFIYACTALINFEESPLKFREIFDLIGYTFDSKIYELNGHFPSRNTVKQMRVIALLFMHEMERTGDL